MDTFRILGTGSYLPQKVLTNFDLQKMGLDTTDEWIVQRTGIRERRVAEPDVAASDLGCEAAIQALDMAGMTAKDLDLIIFATITPDTCCPSAANWLQARLNAPQAVTFDVTAACSGFIFALNVAEQYLKNRTFKHILVVASEVMSRTLNWKDRNTCILWGDGAGAVVLALGNEGPEILSTHIHTDGANGKDLLMPGGGSKTTPICHESVDKGLHHLNMHEANLSFRVAVRYFSGSIKEAADFNNVEIKDMDAIVAELGSGQSSIIPILQAIQEKYNYLPEAALRRVCEISEITPAQIVGVASFYSQFSFIFNIISKNISSRYLRNL